jgi:hypothetical protein
LFNCSCSDIVEPLSILECSTPSDTDKPEPLDPHIRRALILPPSNAAIAAAEDLTSNWPISGPCDRSSPTQPPSALRARIAVASLATPRNDRTSWTTEVEDLSHLVSADACLGGPRTPGAGATSTGRGAMLLLRNMPGVMIANALAEQSLCRQLADLGVERRRSLRRQDRARSEFLDQLKAKGGPLGRLAADIESGKRRWKRNVPPSTATPRCRSTKQRGR